MADLAAQGVAGLYYEPVNVLLQGQRDWGQRAARGRGWGRGIVWMWFAEMESSQVWDSPPAVTVILAPQKWVNLLVSASPLLIHFGLVAWPPNLLQSTSALGLPSCPSHVVGPSQPGKVHTR